MPDSEQSASEGDEGDLRSKRQRLDAEATGQETADDPASSPCSPKPPKHAEVLQLDDVSNPISKKEYLENCKCSFSLPLRLLVVGATEGDLAQFPAAMTPIDAKQRIPYVAAMWSQISEQAVAKPQHLTLVTVDNVPQRVLSGLIASLHSGELESDELVLADQILAADFLQIQSLVEALLVYLVSLVHVEPIFVLSMEQRLHFLRTSASSRLGNTSIKELVQGALIRGYSAALSLDQPDTGEGWDTVKKVLTEGPSNVTYDYAWDAICWAFCPIQALELFLVWLRALDNEDEYRPADAHHQYADAMIARITFMSSNKERVLLHEFAASAIPNPDLLTTGQKEVFLKLLHRLSQAHGSGGAQGLVIPYSTFSNDGNVFEATVMLISKLREPKSLRMPISTLCKVKIRVAREHNDGRGRGWTFELDPEDLRSGNPYHRRFKLEVGCLLRKRDNLRELSVVKIFSKPYLVGPPVEDSYATKAYIFRSNEPDQLTIVQTCEKLRLHNKHIIHGEPYLLLYFVVLTL